MIESHQPSNAVRVRTAYDTIAVDYAAYAATDLQDKPLDRALLTAFAELVRTAGGGPVADVGCGTGRVAAYLHSLGVTVFGVDLSPGMLAVARREYPGLRFDEGPMTNVDVEDGTLGGLMAWYSIIHLLPEELPVAFAEFHRVLAPGGHLLLAFQVGEEPLHLTEAFGHSISLDFHRLSPDRIVELLTRAGFAVTARLLREPEGVERVPQAYLLARKPAE